MLASVLLITAFLNIAFTFQNVCIGKHDIPLNNQSFNILQRSIPYLNQMYFHTFPLMQTVQNNGQTVIIKNIYENVFPKLKGGPYGDIKYRFDFMYFHWLNKSTLASEYFDEDEHFPVELHIVFVDMNYDSFDVAVTKNFGVTVWTFKYKVIEGDYYILNKVFESFESIRHPNSIINITYPETFTPPLNSVYANMFDYYVYRGKAVFGPSNQCSGDVIWIEFPTRLEIHPNQTKHFENLLSFDDKPLMNKFITTAVPNGPIYQYVDRFKYEGQGWSPLPLELFTVSNDANGNDFKIYFIKSILFIILLENLMRLFYVNFQ